MIKAASWRDLSSLRELEKICFPLDAWPLLDMIGVLTLPQVVRLKALENRQMVGFVAGDVRPSQGLGWIATICVHPEIRGQGLGSRLLKECEIQMGMPRVKLTVRASNEHALDLYQRSGYVQVGEWRRYYKGGEHAVVMEKILREQG